MTRLVTVELTRLLWRRAVAGLLVLSVVIPLGVFGLRVFDTRTQTLEQIAANDNSYIFDEIAQCEQRPRRYNVRRDGDVSAACEAQILRWYGNAPLSLVEERENGGGLAAMVLVTMLMLLVGTTFAGHDWTTGSMSNQLLFEPRRSRLWLAKALAVGLLTGAAALAVLVAFWTGLWATASVRDLAIPPHALEAAYKQAFLGAVMAAAAGLFGYALTMLLRSTVATLGLLFAAGFAFIVVVAGVLGVGGTVEPFMPWGNFYAFAVGSYHYYDYNACGDVGGGERCGAGLITRAGAVVYFAVVLIAALTPSVLSFQRRDVA